MSLPMTHVIVHACCYMHVTHPVCVARPSLLYMCGSCACGGRACVLAASGSLVFTCSLELPENGQKEEKRTKPQLTTLAVPLSQVGRPVCVCA